MSFFQDIDWDKLYKRKITPPFLPESEGGDEDAKNFDSEFTSERVVDSFAINVKDEKDSHFEDFTFSGKSELEN